MRVSENTAFNRAVDYVRRSKEKLEDSQEKVGLLRRINKPSDDPIGTVRLLKLRGEKSKLDEIDKNISAARAFMEVSDGALGQVGDILVRAKELAIQQAGDVGTSEITRRTVSEEVSQLYAQMVKLANTKLAGRYLFSGFRTDTAPFDMSGYYHGDSGDIAIEVGDEVFIEMNVSGNHVFLGEDRTDGEHGVDFFKVLERFKIGLLTSDSRVIQDTLEDFDRCIDQNIIYRARVGSRLNSLERLSETRIKKDLNIQSLISLTEDADVYKVFSDLKKNENVLHTTLAASSRVIQPSLLDFLK